MGKLIIDGNSFFEIDEECIKKKRIPKSCDLNKYLETDSSKKIQDKKENKSSKFS